MKRNSFAQFSVFLATGLIVMAGCSRDPNVLKQKALDNGNMYFSAGKFPEACTEYQNAVQLDPKFTEAHKKLADCFLRREMWPSAYQELMRVVDLEPQNFAKHIELGNLLLAGHHSKEEQDRAQLVLAQDPNTCTRTSCWPTRMCPLATPMAPCRKCRRRFNFRRPHHHCI